MNQLETSLQGLEESLIKLEQKLSFKLSTSNAVDNELKVELENFKRAKSKALIIINSLLKRCEELEKEF